MAASTFNSIGPPGREMARRQSGMMSASSLAASPLTSLGYRLTLLCMVLLVGRVPEITASFVGSSLYQIMLLTMVLLPLAIITGVLVTVGASRVGLFWISFHLWVMFTLPFSGYRTGSLDSFTSMMKYFPMTFFVGGFFSRSIETLRKGFWSVAWAGVIGLAWMQYTGVSEDEDRFVAVGTFGNSNLLAIYLLTIIPFWGFIAVNTRYRWTTRLFFAGTIVLSLVSVLKTGSRSGLMTIMLLSVPLFFSLKIASKFKFLAVGGLAVIMALTLLPENLKSRLGTVFTHEATDDASGEAMGSSDARYALLIESLEQTIKHPLVGTGLGVYSAVAAKEKESKGQRALWQVSHNMYTQVSSETGIPGFILYMTTLYFAIKQAWRVKMLTRGDTELRELGMIATALLFSYVSFCFNGCFTSMATEFTLYVFLGFSIALTLVYQQMMRQRQDVNLEAVSNGPVRSARYFPQPDAPAASKPAVVRAAAVPAVATSHDDAPWRRNPRKYPPKAGASPR
jgi:O-antigen ligase